MSYRVLLNSLRLFSHMQTLILKIGSKSFNLSTLLPLYKLEDQSSKNQDLNRRQYLFRISKFAESCLCRVDAPVDFCFLLANGTEKF